MSIDCVCMPFTSFIVVALQQTYVTFFSVWKKVDEDESLIENQFILNNKNWIKDKINLKSVCLYISIYCQYWHDAIILRNSIFPHEKYIDTNNHILQMGITLILYKFFIMKISHCLFCVISSLKLKHSKATFKRNVKIHFGLITLVLSHLILKKCFAVGLVILCLYKTIKSCVFSAECYLAFSAASQFYVLRPKYVLIMCSW